jgi:hypothetical protein
VSEAIRWRLGGSAAEVRNRFFNSTDDSIQDFGRVLALPVDRGFIVFRYRGNTLARGLGVSTRSVVPR